MGMFDYLRVDCRLPLSPDSELRQIMYQTKDLEEWKKYCYEMQYLVITENFSLCNQADRIDFDGEIRFYDHSLEFKAMIIDGIVRNIEAIEYPHKYKPIDREYG